MMKGVGREPVVGKNGLAITLFGEAVLVGVIRRLVFCQKLRGAISDIVGMGKAEVDEKGVFVLVRGTFVEIFEDSFAMPGTSCLCRPAALGRIVHDGELFVGTPVAVAPLAGAHRVVASAVEDLSHDIVDDFRRAGFHCFRGDGEMPDRSSAHDHVAGGRADGSGERAHMMSRVEDHPFRGETIDVGRLLLGVGAIDIEVEGGLVVDDDEEDVGTLVCEAGNEGKQDKGKGEKGFHTRV